MENSKSTSENAISAFIEGLLDRHGVGERQRVRVLELALGLSYAQARRRLLGEAPWTIDDLKRLADHFREPVVPIVAAFLREPGKPATLSIAGAGLPCTAWPAGEPVVGRMGPLVLLHDEAADRWTVVPAALAADRASYELAALLFERPAPHRVAVLGADSASVRQTVATLCTKGIDARPFATIEALLSASECERIDGFVLEWSRDSSTELLARLRARHPDGPLIILAEDIDADAANENLLACASTSYRALVLEQSTNPLTLLNALQLGFCSAADSRKRQS